MPSETNVNFRFKILDMGEKNIWTVGSRWLQKELEPIYTQLWLKFFYLEEVQAAQ